MSRDPQGELHIGSILLVVVEILAEKPGAKPGQECRYSRMTHDIVEK